MGLTLYYADASPAARGSLLLVRALGLEVELKEVDLGKGEHLTADYLAINPLHTVPTLRDGDFTVWDSQAINIYLAEKYGKDSPLYPNDPQKRAVIHQRLFFHSGVLFPRMGAIVVSLLREGAKSVSKDKADALTQGYSQLETLLERCEYVAGDDVTLADLSVAATLTSANALVPIASNRFPRICDWLGRMRRLPFFEHANGEGLQRFVAMVRSRLA